MSEQHSAENDAGLRDRVTALADQLESDARADKGPCYGSNCPGCTKGRLAASLYSALRETRHIPPGSTEGGTR